MRLKWPSRHKENYPFLVTCSFLWVTKIAINFPLGKHFSWPITCEWKTEGKLGLRYHISKEKLKEVILGQIFTLTSFLNNLLNFLRVILENAIGSTDKYKQCYSEKGIKNAFLRPKNQISVKIWDKIFTFVYGKGQEG